MVRICLVLFIKNDEITIHDIIDSVSSIIDAYIIYDLGSTDKTVDIINTFFDSKHILGKIIKIDPDKLIENYPRILDESKTIADYTLLLNSDTVVIIDPKFDKLNIQSDIYRIKTICGNDINYLISFIRNDVNYRLFGVDMFCLDCPQDKYLDRLDGITMFDRQYNISRQEKRRCDIHLCKYHLLMNSKQPSYYFYLAKCYQCLNNNKSIKWYNKRLKHQGWGEEIFISHLELGKILHNLGKDPEFINHMLEAYNVDNNRIESLYELVSYYRSKRGYYMILSNQFIQLASNINSRSYGYLGIREDIYDYLLDYEQSIISYYLDKPIDYHKYLNIIGYGCYEGAIRNYKFYVKYLCDLKPHNYTYHCDTMINNDYHPMIPSIISSKNGYVMNYPYVNYDVDKNGSYVYKYPITTLNYQYVLDINLNLIQQQQLCYHQLDHDHIGIENIKLFNPNTNTNSELMFVGTDYDIKTKQKTLVGGKYPTLQKTFKSNIDINKWTYINHNGSIKVITNWFPLTINTIDQDGRIKSTSLDQEIPLFFKYLYSSTNGFEYDHEIWFITHMIDFSVPRVYYFCIVVLDCDTLKYKRHSILFKFNNSSIEQCYGLIVEKQRIICSCSRSEKDALVIVYDRPIIDNYIF